MILTIYCNIPTLIGPLLSYHQSKYYPHSPNNHYYLPILIILSLPCSPYSQWCHFLTLYTCHTTTSILSTSTTPPILYIPPLALPLLHILHTHHIISIILPTITIPVLLYTPNSPHNYMHIFILMVPILAYYKQSLYDHFQIPWINYIITKIFSSILTNATPTIFSILTIISTLNIQPLPYSL